MNHSGITRATADVESLICATATEIAQEYFPAGLTAVIVTGSTARGESSIREIANQVIVLGDLELVVVTPDGSAISALKDKIRAALNSKNVLCEVSVMFCSMEQLLGLPPSIFTYELRECGKVLLGDPSTLSAKKRVQSSELPREDAWQMLGNRAVELLEALSAERTDDSTGQIGYRVAKLYLDICTSLLVFLREYEPSYSARTAKLLSNLREYSNRVDADLSELALQARLALDAKLSGADIKSFASAHAIDSVLHFLLLISNWELQQLERNATLDTYISARDLQARVRGWAAVTRRVSPKDAAINALRWSSLVRRGSPRHLIYKIAFELLSARDSITSQMLTESNQLLPLPARGRHTWIDVAQATAVNYHRFVEVTRS